MLSAPDRREPACTACLALRLAAGGRPGRGRSRGAPGCPAARRGGGGARPGGGGCQGAAAAPPRL